MFRAARMVECFNCVFWGDLYHVRNVFTANDIRLRLYGLTVSKAEFGISLPLQLSDFVLSSKEHSSQV